MKRDTLYWIVTGIFCTVFLFGGVSHLLRSEAMAQSMTGLGYPLYVMTILGTAKVLGAMALLVPGWAILKEWAYAGFAFDLIGATASHSFVGDPLSETLPPLALLLLGAASYALRPPARRVVAASRAESDAVGVPQAVA